MTKNVSFDHRNIPLNKCAAGFCPRVQLEARTTRTTSLRYSLIAEYDIDSLYHFNKTGITVITH